MVLIEKNSNKAICMKLIVDLVCKSGYKKHTKLLFDHVILLAAPCTTPPRLENNIEMPGAIGIEISERFDETHHLCNMSWQHVPSSQ